MARRTLRSWHAPSSWPAGRRAATTAPDTGPRPRPLHPPATSPCTPQTPQAGPHHISVMRAMTASISRCAASSQRAASPASYATFTSACHRCRNSSWGAGTAGAGAQGWTRVEAGRACGACRRARRPRHAPLCTAQPCPAAGARPPPPSRSPPPPPATRAHQVLGPLPRADALLEAGVAGRRDELHALQRAAVQPARRARAVRLAQQELRGAGARRRPWHAAARVAGGRGHRVARLQRRIGGVGGGRDRGHRVELVLAGQLVQRAGQALRRLCCARLATRPRLQPLHLHLLLQLAPLLPLLVRLQAGEGGQHSVPHRQHPLIHAVLLPQQRNLLLQLWG